MQAKRKNKKSKKNKKMIFDIKQFFSTMWSDEDEDEDEDEEEEIGNDEQDTNERSGLLRK